MFDSFTLIGKNIIQTEFFQVKEKNVTDAKKSMQ